MLLSPRLVSFVKLATSMGTLQSPIPALPVKLRLSSVEMSGVKSRSMSTRGGPAVTALSLCRFMQHWNIHTFQTAVGKIKRCRRRCRTDVVRKREAFVPIEVDLATVGLHHANLNRQLA